MGTESDIQATHGTRSLRPSSPREAVDAFVGLLKRRNRSANTLKRYGADLEAFVNWAGDRSLSDIDATDIDFGFFPYWVEQFEKRNEREPSPATLRAVHCALSSFYKFLSNYGYLADENGHPMRNPMLAIEAPKLKQRRNDYLRRQEDEALLDLQLDCREEILVWFLRLTGLRLDEALSLRIRDVDIEDRTIFVNNSKSENGIRELPIVPELVPRIRRWLMHLESLDLHRPRGAFLCTTRRGVGKDKDGTIRRYDAGNPMKAQQVEAIIRRVGEQADIERLTPHRLRRTFGSSLLNAGVRLETVSDLLGHADSRITQQAYAQLSSDTVRRELLEALGGRQ